MSTKPTKPGYEEQPIPSAPASEVIGLGGYDHPHHYMQVRKEKARRELPKQTELLYEMDQLMIRLAKKLGLSTLPPGATIEMTIRVPSPGWREEVSEGEWIYTPAGTAQARGSYRLK